MIRVIKGMVKNLGKRFNRKTLNEELKEQIKFIDTKIIKNGELAIIFFNDDQDKEDAIKIELKNDLVIENFITPQKNENTKRLYINNLLFGKEEESIELIFDEGDVVGSPIIKNGFAFVDVIKENANQYVGLQMNVEGRNVQIKEAMEKIKQERKVFFKMNRDLIQQDLINHLSKHQIQYALVKSFQDKMMNDKGFGLVVCSSEEESIKLIGVSTFKIKFERFIPKNTKTWAHRARNGNVEKNLSDTSSLISDLKKEIEHLTKRIKKLEESIKFSETIETKFSNRASKKNSSSNKKNLNKKLFQNKEYTTSSNTNISKPSTTKKSKKLLSNVDSFKNHNQELEGRETNNLSVEGKPITSARRSTRISTISTKL